MVKANSREMPVVIPMERRIDPNIAEMSVRLGVLQSEMTGVRNGLQEMSAAITRLAVIEERLIASSSQQDRAFEMIREMRSEHREAIAEMRESKKKLEDRIEALEVQQPIKDMVANWVLYAVWGGVGLLVLYVLKKVGIA